MRLGKLVAISILAATCFLDAETAATAETSQGTAQIVNGDLVAARNSALGDAIWSATSGKEVSVSTKSAMIGGQYQDATLVSQRSRISNLRIVSENVEGSKLTVLVSYEYLPNEGDFLCGGEQPALRNIRLVWEKQKGNDSDPKIRDGRSLIAKRFSELMHRMAKGYISNVQNNASVVFSLSIELVEKKGGWFSAASSTMAYALRGPGDVTIFEGHFDFPAVTRAERAKRNLGYATLVQLELSDETELMLQDAAQTISRRLKCIPGVARLSKVSADGKTSIYMEHISRELETGALLLYSKYFPLQPGGVLDLLKLEGTVKVEHSDSGTLDLKILPSSDKTRAISDGFVIFY